MSINLLKERVGNYMVDVIIFDIRTVSKRLRKYEHSLEHYLKKRYKNYSLCGGETRRLIDEVKFIPKV